MTPQPAKHPHQPFVEMTLARQAELAVESINDLLEHAEVVIARGFSCPLFSCELCARWARVCNAALGVYDGPVLPDDEDYVPF